MNPMASFVGFVLILTAAPACAQRFGGGEMFGRADANNDGVITRAEFDTSRAARFAEADRNRDGYVSHADFKRLRFAPQKARDRIDQLIGAMDENGDGRVSRAEMVEGPSPLFDRADINQDDRLDGAEVAAARERMAGMKKR